MEKEICVQVFRVKCGMKMNLKKKKKSLTRPILDQEIYIFISKWASGLFYLEGAHGINDFMAQEF